MFHGDSCLVTRGDIIGVLVEWKPIPKLFVNTSRDISCICKIRKDDTSVFDGNTYDWNIWLNWIENRSKLWIFFVSVGFNFDLSKNKW